MDQANHEVIFAVLSKKPKPMGFWANAEMFEVTDVKKYNRAVAKLFGLAAEENKVGAAVTIYQYCHCRENG